MIDIQFEMPRLTANRHRQMPRIPLSGIWARRRGVCSESWVVVAAVDLIFKAFNG